MYVTCEILYLLLQERERERDTDRQTDRQTDTQTDKQRQSGTQRQIKSRRDYEKRKMLEAVTGFFCSRADSLVINIQLKTNRKEKNE